MKPSRRKFLRSSVCGLTAASMISSLEKFNLVDALVQDRPDVADDYRALVCIFLFGGTDGNNMIVPYTQYDDAGGYGAVRSGSGLAVPKSALLQIAPPSQGGNIFGFHPNLSAEVANPTQQFKGLLDIWNQGKLAVLCNYGSLVQPITRAQYQAGIGHPYQLFSHSDQQTQQQTIVANTSGQTGWGGRIADRSGSLNPLNSPLPMNVSIAGSSLFGTGISTRQLTVSSQVILGQVLELQITGGTDADKAARRSTLVQLAGYDTDKILFKTADDIMNQALQTSAALANAFPQLATTFPPGLGYQLRQVANIIKFNRDAGLGMKRHLFFCALGGFDTHINQTGNNPISPNIGGNDSGNQGFLLNQLSRSMRAFYQEMVAQGISDKVTTFTLSDFGRTLQPSGAGAGSVGSDHAWGGHSLIMGGSVLGGRFYGTYPTLALGGPDDTDSRGRWIPTTSIEQYAATLATWYGLAPSDVPAVFPNLSRFSPPNLGFLT